MKSGISGISRRASTYPLYGTFPPPVPSIRSSLFNLCTFNFICFANFCVIADTCAPESIKAGNLFPPICTFASFDSPINLNNGSGL